MNKENALREGERCDSKWCEVRPSGIHGRGLFAKRRIPEGTRIIQYTGERIDKAESDRRAWARIAHAKKTGDAAVYIFTLNEEFDIDGNVPENAARLINHSCHPNCEAYIEDDAIWISALGEIAKGEELFYNYGFDLDSWEEHPCRCGASRCIGYIAAEEHWPALKRKIKKQQLNGKATPRAAAKKKIKKKAAAKPAKKSPRA